MAGKGGCSPNGRPVPSRPAFLAPRLPDMKVWGGLWVPAGVINGLEVAMVTEVTARGAAPVGAPMAPALPLGTGAWPASAF